MSRPTIIDDQTETEIRSELIKQESRKVRKRPDSAVTAKKAGDNSEMLAHQIKLYRLQPVDMNDAEAVENRIAEYFSICYDDDERPTVAGLALALGTNRQRIWEIDKGKSGRPKAVCDVVQRAYSLINSSVESLLSSGRGNPVACIFSLKANHGYIETQRVEISAQNDDAMPTAEELDAKYRDALPIDYADQIADYE